MGGRNYGIIKRWEIPTILRTVGGVNDLSYAGGMTLSHRLSDRAVWLVTRASVRAQHLIQDQLAAGQVRKHHYGILASVADVGPAAQGPLADRICIDRSDMVSLLDELEDLGYVVRRPDPADRRRNIIEITDPGRAALQQLDQLVYAADDELLAPLTPAERETLARLLARIVLPVSRPAGARPPSA
jgi:MarR family transcriptional regulator, lower aerobic nicotinate degradation pathway regulator